MNARYMVHCIWVYFLLLFTPFSTVCQPVDLNGSWVGWIYFDGRGDLPIQFHLDRTSDHPSPTYDSPAEEKYGQMIEHAHLLLNDSIEIMLSSTFVLRGRISEDRILGRVDLGTNGASFDLTRSAVPLIEGDSATYNSYNELVGVFGDGKGGGVVISQQFWKELLFTNLKSGQHGTLFRTSSGSFIAGPRLYVPNPIKNQARFQRDQQGNVIALVWEDESGSKTLPRIAYETIDVAIEAPGHTTAASILLPQSEKEIGAILLMGGGSWYTREDVLNDAYRILSSGRAVMIFDRRGFGLSTGEQLSCFSDIADDAVRCIDYLVSHPAIDLDQIGVLGKSRSGWIAPMVANRSPEIDHVVLVVSPCVSPVDQETNRKLNLVRSVQASETELALAEAYLNRMYEFALTGKGWSTYELLRKDCDSLDLLGSLGAFSSQDDLNLDWWKVNGSYDPIPELEKLEQPVLAIYTDSDQNVGYEINSQLLKAALTSNSNTDLKIEVIKNADHYLWKLEQDPSDLRYHRRFGFQTEYWKELFKWLEER